MSAFKGLLESRLGPLMDGVRDAEAKLAPALEEARKVATPIVEDMVDGVRKAVSEVNY